MEKKILLNQLILAYSPISNYDFCNLKSDTGIQRALENSSLYIIGQRPELHFDNVVINEKLKIIKFEIKQKNNPKVLKCEVPLFQKVIASNPEIDILIYLGFDDNKDDFETNPRSNVVGIKFYQGHISEDNFLIWFSPEKFLQNYWRGHLQALIHGNIRNFTKYQVHYIGQTTKQDIWKRLIGHKKLQDILSIEYPLCYGSLPTHEIVILLFQFHENLQIQSFVNGNSINDKVDSFLGKKMPKQKTIFLDAEKALINAIQPKYNNVIFKNYPKSIDGLDKYNYDCISYTFIDPITLIYKKGTIEGCLSLFGGDTITIQNNRMVVLKHKV